MVYILTTAASPIYSATTTCILVYIVKNMYFDQKNSYILPDYYRISSLDGKAADEILLLVYI